MPTLGVQAVPVLPTTSSAPITLLADSLTPSVENSRHRLATRAVTMITLMMQVLTLIFV